MSRQKNLFQFICAQFIGNSNDAYLLGVALYFVFLFSNCNNGLFSLYVTVTFCPSYKSRHKFFKNFWLIMLLVPAMTDAAIKVTILQLNSIFAITMIIQPWTRMNHLRDGETIPWQTSQLECEHIRNLQLFYLLLLLT